MRHGFSVTYEVVTPESAEHGDAEDRGFIAEDLTLRDALDAWDGAGYHVEADCCPVDGGPYGVPRWFTAYKVNNGTRECYETGAEESRGLHLPDDVTPETALRIARLVGCYGVAPRSEAG